MRDYHLVVPADCTVSNTVEENDHALEEIRTVLKAGHHGVGAARSAAAVAYHERLSCSTAFRRNVAAPARWNRSRSGLSLGSRWPRSRTRVSVFYRAGLLGVPYLRPLLSAAAILVCGVLWLRRFRRATGGGVAMLVGLLIVTAGVYSGYSALNAPFVGFVARFCVPLLLVFLGAVLLFAEQETQFQIVPLVLAATAFIVVQVVLTREARSEPKPIPLPCAEEVSARVRSSVKWSSFSLRAHSSRPSMPTIRRRSPPRQPPIIASSIRWAMRLLRRSWRQLGKATSGWFPITASP
jgi:hypothetical protein